MSETKNTSEDQLHDLNKKINNIFQRIELQEKDQNSQNKNTEMIINSIRDKLEIISLKLDRKEITPSQADGKPMQFWRRLAQVLGVAAIIMTILFQITKTTHVFIDKEKIAAETKNIQLEELKIKAELKLLLEKIKEKKINDTKEYERQLDEAIPRLQAIIAKIDNIKKEEELSENAKKFAIKTMIILVIMIFIPIFFELIYSIWDIVIDQIDKLLKSKTNHKTRLKKKIFKITSSFLSIIRPIPRILNWTIQAFVFIWIFIPFIDSGLQMLGASESLNSIVDSLKSLNIGEALSKLKLVLME